MQSFSRARKTAATSFGTLARASAGVAVMLLSMGKVEVGALQTAARTRRWLSSRPAASAVDRVHSSLQEEAVGARRAETSPEKSEADAPSFFERMGSPRYIAAPMVEQSEAGEPFEGRHSIRTRGLVLLPAGSAFVCIVLSSSAQLNE